MPKFKIALVQLNVGEDKAENLAAARRMVLEASASGAQMVVLPECFNSPYGTQYFDKYAEAIKPNLRGETVEALSKMAAEAGVYLVGGSIPERESKSGSSKLFNTSTVFDNKGALLAVHRKVHLCDIEVPGKIRLIESEVLSAGDKATTFDTPWGKIGLGICYDVRFPELAMVAARRDGIKVMLYPAAYNMTTGPLHWELLLRARAIDNMIYVAGCGPAHDLTKPYIAWGHSMVVGPDGAVLANGGFGETIVYSDIGTTPAWLGSSQLTKLTSKLDSRIFPSQTWPSEATLASFN